MAAYCNITTDLTDVFPDLEQYQEKDILEDWTIVTGQTLTYYKNGVGQVNMVFENGVQMTLKTTIAEVEAAAKSWWYDATIDILYIHTTAGTAPSNYTIEIGEDWDNFKTRMRNEAQIFLDGFLARRYTVPLLPRKEKTHTTDKYDKIIKDITANLVCYYIIRRRNPNHPAASAFWKKVWNDPAQTGEGEKGLINLLVDGDHVLQNQIVPYEVGRWSGPYPYSSNTIEESPILRGQYEGSYYRRWRIQIDTAGAPGTGTYKVSFDGGTNWDLTLQDMKDATSDENRMYIGSGVYVEWPVVTYVESEYWDFEFFPQTDIAQGQKVGSVGIWR